MRSKFISISSLTRRSQWNRGTQAEVPKQRHRHCQTRSMLEDHCAAVHSGSSRVIPRYNINSAIDSPPCQFSAFNPFLPTLTKWHSASSATSLLACEKCVTCCQAGQPFRGTFASCKNGLVGHSAKANAKDACIYDEISRCKSTGWGSSVGKDLRILVDNELNMSQK